MSARWADDAATIAWRLGVPAAIFHFHIRRHFKKLTVVTDENPKPQKRKIPAACDHFGVPWMNGYQLLREEKWQYIRAR